MLNDSGQDIENQSFVAFHAVKRREKAKPPCKLQGPRGKERWCEANRRVNQVIPEMFSPNPFTRNEILTGCMFSQSLFFHLF